METITETFTQNHSHCDQLFAEAEESVSKAQWDHAAINLANFLSAMERHFRMEEEVLFPSIEEHIGHTGGPTQVMRMEHQQMRQIFAEMQTSLNQRDSEQYLGHSETLLMLMRQHNAKEEQILYPMSDQVLNGEVSSVLNRMQGNEA